LLKENAGQRALAAGALGCRGLARVRAVEKRPRHFRKQAPLRSYWILTGHEDLSTRTLVHEGGGISVNRAVLVGVDGAALVDGLTNHVDDSAESLGADGHENGCAGIGHGLATHEAFGGVQSDGSHVVATEMLGDLEHESVFSSVDLKSVENWGQSTLELHVHDGTNNLRNLSFSDSSAEATYTHSFG
jgi:hypothetical protein